MVAKVANPNPAFVLVAELAQQFGVSIDKVNRWRQAGILPEFVKVGRIHMFPAEKIGEVRDRLVTSGHIDPERDFPFVRASALALPTAVS